MQEVCRGCSCDTGGREGDGGAEWRGAGQAEAGGQRGHSLSEASVDPAGRSGDALTITGGLGWGDASGPCTPVDQVQGAGHSGKGVCPQVRGLASAQESLRGEGWGLLGVPLPASTWDAPLIPEGIWGATPCRHRDTAGL